MKKKLLFALKPPCHKMRYVSRNAVVLAVVGVFLLFSFELSAQSTNGLIGYWSFDETRGSIASDGSGNGNTGSLQGNAVFATGKLGNAISLDGTNSWVDIPNQSLSGDFTIAAWVNLSGTVNNQDALVGQDVWGQDINFAGQNLRLYTGSGDAIVANSTVSLGTWTHCAITRSGSTLTVYINGTLDNTSTGFTVPFTPQAIGRGAQGSLTQGLIDEVYLYNRTLNSSEIQVIFNDTGADTQAPSIPTGLASSNKTQTSFTLSWTASTDNVGVTGYEVFRNGVSIGTTASTSISVTGLSCGTSYAMSVRARDAVPNWSAQSSASNVSTSNCPDTQAPSVPTGLSSSNITQTSFTLSWTASTDNVGVTGYEVFKNGVSIGTTASTSMSVTGLSCGTSCAMTVRAKDAALNWSAQSSALNVATSGCSTNLIGYWSFDETSGSTASDGSGNGNTGNLQGNATFATGKIGNAISLDGTNSWIDIPNQSLSGDFTIAAWVNLSGTVNNQDALVGQDVWGQDINFAGQNLRLYTGSGDAIVANSTVSLGTWTHCAITRSGSTLTVYINGTLDNTSTGFTAPFTPQAIGRGAQGALTQGLIDEVYLYSNALNATDIQNLYNVTGSSDTQAPSVPTGLSSSNITQNSFTVSWTASSDNVGVTGYEVFKDGSSIGTTTSTSMSVTGLTCGTAYAMTVRARDAAANWSAQSSALNVSTLACSGGDITAPSIPTGLASSNLGATNFTLSWTASTDNVGVTGYEVFKDGASVGTTTSTSMSIYGLSPSTIYAMTVRAKDAVPNWSAQSSALNVTTTTQQATTRVNNVGVDITGYGGAGCDWMCEKIWRNAIRASRYWSKAASAITAADANLDANGWPTEDAICMVYAGLRSNNNNGTYKLMFECNNPTGVTINELWGGGVLQNKTNNGNNVTADLVISDVSNERMAISFTNTSGGVRNVKLMRPVIPGSTVSYSDTEPFTDQLIAAIAPFKAVRYFGWYNSGNILCDSLWSDVTDWNYATQQPFTSHGSGNKACPSWKVLSYLLTGRIPIHGFVSLQGQMIIILPNWPLCSGMVMQIVLPLTQT